MSFYLDTGSWNSVFAIPTDLIDKHIKNCDEYSLKIILVLLRYPCEKFTKEGLYEKAGVPVSFGDRALNYWIKAGFIGYDNNVLSPTISNEIKKESPQTNQSMKKMLRPDSIYIAQRLRESEDLSHLFADAQAILGKTLSPSLSAVLLIAHDDYCLPIEVITMMISYCNSVGRSSTSFFEALAKNWYELGITTIEQAEKRIEEISQRSNAWKTLCSTIGLPYRQPIKSELDLAYDAICQMKFSKEMILLAYEKTIAGTGKLQPKYMFKILQAWYKSKIVTPFDLEKYEGEKKTSYNKKASTDTDITPSYDLSKFDELNVFDIKDE